MNIIIKYNSRKISNNIIIKRFDRVKLNKSIWVSVANLMILYLQEHLINDWVSVIVYKKNSEFDKKSLLYSIILIWLGDSFFRCKLAEIILINSNSIDT